MSTSKWKIVGLSGATCSGKTTVADSIISLYPESVIVKQDDYFWDNYDPHHITIPELNHHNWECLQSIDWDSMINDIKEMLKEPPKKDALFLVEGHIIFNYANLEQLFDKKYFITLTEEECFARRNNRVYDPPDCPKYFELCIWPMYLSNLKDVKTNCSNVIYLDGTQPVKEIVKIVLDDLKNL